MSMTCSICKHPQRASIEAAIVAGTPYRDIALHHGLGSHMAVSRHAEHIQQEIKQSQAAKEEAQGLDVVKQLKTVNSVTLAILKEARAEKKNGMALFAIDRVLKQLELQAKLLGDINEAQEDQSPYDLRMFLAKCTIEELAIIQPVMDAVAAREREKKIIPMRRTG